MSDDDRRVFPMETALGVVAGKDGNEVLDFLGYTIGREVCECARPVVAPMVKGWLYSQNPAFMQHAYEDGQPYEFWVNEQKKRLGENVSLTPMPTAEASGMAALLDTLAAAKATVEEKTQAAATAMAEAEQLAPFKAKAEELEKKAAQLEEKNKALTEEVKTLKAELAGFSGKIALNESEIEQSVKDMVSKAVKDALASLPVAAAGAAVATGDAASADAPAAAADSGATAAPADDFGFGTSGAGDDGFGF